MKLRKWKKAGRFLNYLFLTALAVIMIYPLFWLSGSAFKDNNEIITSLSIFPREWKFNSFVQGWKGNGKYTYLFFSKTLFSWWFPPYFLRYSPACWYPMGSHGFAFL